MVEAVRRSIRRWRVSKAIQEARRRGHGLYSTEWDANPATIESLPVDITHWCRETLARCRRPMGIDHFDLTLTVRREDGEPRTHRMAFLRPAQLYEDTGLTGSLAAVFGPLALAGESGSVKVVAALLSWGDIAHATMS